MGIAWTKTGTEGLESHTLLSMTEMKIAWAWVGGCREWEVAGEPKQDTACIPCRVVRISILKTVGTC